jgi:galactonate dehydratase
MRITALETLWGARHPHMAHLLVHTDEGVTGLGEIMPRPGAAIRIIHDVFAEIVLGANPLHREQLWVSLFQAISYHGWHGSEMRALSAFDIALWDIAGKSAQMPVYMLLGGPCRETIPVYNTCVSHANIRDHELFEQDPAALARSLLEDGLRIMKIWPFDDASTLSGGHYLDKAAMTAGIRVLEKIRDAVGGAVEIGIEAHACWDLAAAKHLARELERFDVLFLEEPIQPHNARTMHRLAAYTRIPICGSERVFARYGLRSYIEQGAMDIVMMDPIMVGGITEWRKCAALADAYQLPVMAHACNGPVTFTAAAHLCAHVPNLYLMEFVRAFHRRWYETLVTGVASYRDGAIGLPQGCGLGIALNPEYVSQADIRREVSEGERRKTISFASGDPWHGGLGDSL